jgi:hypothetical protein
MIVRRTVGSLSAVPDSGGAALCHPNVTPMAHQKPAVIRVNSQSGWAMPPWTASLSNSSVFSMSISIAFRP